jgi:pyruvate,water dikinase
MKNNLVAPLSEFSASHLEQAGGKGANLGELIHAGFPVPPGFVVTTTAYDAFVKENNLDPIVLIVRQTTEEAATAIQAAFEKAIIPKAIKQAVLEAYCQLGQRHVAVRSSATAEDLPQAAFAGQQDTYLNVIGEQPLLDAVRKCWGSLWSERAISYRARQGIDQKTVKLAVVVQELVAAEAAGVMFTANPVSGARDEIVVDANPGLGEAVVSGLVTPDHFVIHNQHGRLEIRERKLGRREAIVQALPEGGTYQIEGEALDVQLTMPDQLVLRLAHTGLDIQRHFGRPQDIEWAVAKSKVHILQARPITALPEPLPHSNRLVRTLSAIFSEMFPVRPYPLDQTTWIHAISAAAVDPLFGLIGISVPSFDHLFIEEDGVIVRFSGKLAVRPTPALLLAPARLLWLSSRYDPMKASSDPVLLQARQVARLLEALELQGLSWTELIDVVQKALDLALPLAGEIRRRYYPRALLAAGFLRVILSILGLGRFFGDLSSAPESTTTEANQALEALAARVRADPQLAQALINLPPELLTRRPLSLPVDRDFLADFNDFLERFGHRELVLSSVLQPTWKDAPEVVLGMIQGLARSASPARRDQGWGQARDRLYAHSLMKFSPLRRFMLDLVATARGLWQIREDTHFDATRIIPILRRTFFELGRRLVSVGVIEVPEDIFHLKFNQLERLGSTWPPEPELIGELRACVQRRKEKRLSLEHLPVVDPRLYQPVNLDREALLTGTPGSPGIGEGPVCVITSTGEFGRLQAGDVLVAPYTNPAWTPLFQRAAAVVVDGGAAGSHASIVAREYGLPAVFGTIDGTRRLKDGQSVRVDGSRGLVFALREASENPGEE